MLHIKYYIIYILNNLFAKLCVFIMWNTCSIVSLNLFELQQTCYAKFLKSEVTWMRLKPTTSWFVNEYSTIWPNWGFRQYGWVFIYELRGYGFNSDSSYLRKFSKTSSPYGLRNCFSTYSLNQDHMFVLKTYF